MEAMIFTLRVGQGIAAMLFVIELLRWAKNTLKQHPILETEKLEDVGTGKSVKEPETVFFDLGNSEEKKKKKVKKAKFNKYGDVEYYFEELEEVVV